MSYRASAVTGATVVISCLLAFPSLADPVSMNDAALARVVGGQTESR